MGSGGALSTEKDIQEALERVRTIVEEVVRKEQHRNDVTQLPNERALDVFLEEAIQEGGDLFIVMPMRVD